MEVVVCLVDFYRSFVHFCNQQLNGRPPRISNDMLLLFLNRHVFSFSVFLLSFNSLHREYFLHFFFYFFFKRKFSINFSHEIDSFRLDSTFVRHCKASKKSLFVWSFSSFTMTRKKNRMWCKRNLSHRKRFPSYSKQKMQWWCVTKKL